MLGRFVLSAPAFSAIGVLLGSAFRTSRAAQGAGLMLWFVMMILGSSQGYCLVVDWVASAEQCVEPERGPEIGEPPFRGPKDPGSRGTTHLSWRRPLRGR